MEMDHKPHTDKEFPGVVADYTDPFGTEPSIVDDTGSFRKSRRYNPWQDDCVTEFDIARENGCWIDDDGHWQPLDDEYDW